MACAEVRERDGEVRGLVFLAREVLAELFTPSNVMVPLDAFLYINEPRYTSPAPLPFSAPVLLPLAR